jgi:hypothetical protein
VLSEIDFELLGSAGHLAINMLPDPTKTDREDIYMDRLNVRAMGTGRTFGITVRPGTRSNRSGLWGCTFASREPMLGDFASGAAHWHFTFGCNFATEGQSHITYTNVHFHSLHKWVKFSGAWNPKIGFAPFCINFNIHDTGHPGYVGYRFGDHHVVSECYFSGRPLGIDVSNSANDTTTLIRYFIVERCRFDSLERSAVNSNSAQFVTLRDNECWRAKRFFAPNGATLGGILEARIYRNKAFFDAGRGKTVFAEYSRGTFTVPQQITDNVIVDIKAGSTVVNLKSADQISAASLIARNIYYLPNIRSAPSGAYFMDDGTAKTLVELQATGLERGSVHANPHWRDPANGIF